MPELLGSVAAMRDLLGASEDDTFDEAQVTRMTATLETVGALVQHMTRAQFGVSTPETLLEENASGVRLFLSKGLRSVTSISENPTIWNGTSWSGGSALTTSQYRLTSQVSNGAYRTITRVDGAWGGNYLITGVWEDRVADVPPEITYVVNYLSAELWKKQPMSPAGALGPDGTTIPLRNAFADPEVKKTLGKWTVGPLVWVV